MVLWNILGTLLGNILGTLRVFTRAFCCMGNDLLPSVGSMIYNPTYPSVQKNLLPTSKFRITAKL